MADIRITLYTDGACSGNPGPGGYAAILVAQDDTGQARKEHVVVGSEAETTNNRMEMRAVIEGLKALTKPSPVRVVSDSEYVVNTMTRNWKRRKNHDLWEELDTLCATHDVTWEHIKGHAGHKYNERADRLAVAEIRKMQKPSNQRE